MRVTEKAKVKTVKLHKPFLNYQRTLKSCAFASLKDCLRNNEV